MEKDSQNNLSLEGMLQEIGGELRPRVVKTLTPRAKKPKGAPTIQIKKDALQILETALNRDIVEKAPGLPGRPNKQTIMESFKHFETAVGGRGQLIQVLQHCPTNSNGFNLIQKLLEDPEFLELIALEGNDEVAKNTLGRICAKRKISLGALIQAFRDAKIAKMTIETLTAVQEHVPSVMGQIAMDAQNRWEPCKVCNGTMRIPRIGDNGEWAVDEYGAPVTQLCFACRGSGKVWVQHDFSNRELFLKQVGLIQKSDKPLVNIDNRSVNIGSSGEGSFDSVMKKLDTLVRPVAKYGTEDEEVIDVQPQSDSEVSEED